MICANGEAAAIHSALDAILNEIGVLRKDLKATGKA